MTVSFEREDVKKIHEIQLQMLMELDRICRMHGIKYIISGGTLLGAVRNGGFIPWDDDIDVRMLRGEYQKLCDVIERELDTDKYFFQTHNTDSEYPWYYGKLRYKKSKYVRSGQEHLEISDGIFIDIMPADGLPNTKILRRWVIIKAYILKKFLYASVGSFSEENFLKRNAYKLMDKVPKTKIYDLLDKLSKKYEREEYLYVTSYSFVKCKQKEFTERSWHTELIEILFEGQKVYAPKEYKRWLEMTYGSDYMIPPSVEKQVGHNDISYFYIEE